MKKIYVYRYLFVVAVLAGAVSGQSGGTFTITQSVIANGGGTSGGSTFSVTGTTGQSLAGTLSNGAPFNVRGGFWQNSSSSNVTVA